VTKNGISRIRSVVSQLASPMGHPRKPTVDCSTCARGRLAAPAPLTPDPCGDDASPRGFPLQAIRLELGHEPARDFDLEADPLGLVAALEHPTLLVAEREGRSLAIRDEEREAFDARAKRLVDPRKEPVDAGTGQ